MMHILLKLFTGCSQIYTLVFPLHCGIWSDTQTDFVSEFVKTEKIMHPVVPLILKPNPDKEKSIDKSSVKH